MSLDDKLKAVKEGFAKTAPPEALKVIGKALGSLVEAGALERTAKEGDTMPPFELADSEEKMVNSGDLLSRGPLVVHFYRGVW
jgi:hypothetical protein